MNHWCSFLNDETVLGLVVLVVLILIAYCQYCAYYNGVTDGYGYAKEPGHPGYERAGRYLRRWLTHRWPELKEDAPNRDSL